MKNKIAYFFNNIDNAIYNNPIKLAQEYLYFLITNYKETMLDNSNAIFITLDDNNLADITKRCFLISDGLSLSCKSSKSIRIGVNYSNSTKYATGYYTFNNNLFKLGTWIQKSRSLLISGKLAYFPNTYKYQYPITEIGDFFVQPQNVTTITNFTSITDVIIKNRKITSISNNPTNKYIKPTLLLNMPIIETIDLEDFCNITLNSLEPIAFFQDYLRHSLLSIDSNSQKELERLSLELNLQLKDISRRYQRIISQYHMTTAIGCIGIITAMLFIISPNISELVKTAVGAGSTYGLIPFLKTLQNCTIEKMELSNSPCYFLWILQQQ